MFFQYQKLKCILLSQNHSSIFNVTQTELDTTISGGGAVLYVKADMPSRLL